MDPLKIPKSEIDKNSSIPVEVLPDNESLVARFADDLLGDYLSARAAGREKVVFILPVGPIGQYEILADRCNREEISLMESKISAHTYQTFHRRRDGRG